MRRSCCSFSPDTSLFCPVTFCFATSGTGYPCTERSGCEPGEGFCACNDSHMAGIWWSGERHVTPKEAAVRIRGDGYNPWSNIPAPPGGRYGSGFCPVKAGDSLRRVFCGGMYRWSF